MEDIIFFIYDNKGKCIGFTLEEEDAKEMAIEHNGHYELKFTR